MRIAIVDDQKEFLEIAEKNIMSLRYHIETFTSVNELKGNYDLILLDIEMPDCDGITYSKNHREQNIIFMTSHFERIKEAFGSNIYGFIEKMDSPEFYQKTIKKALNEIKQQEYVFFRIDSEYEKFIIKDIVYMQYIAYKTIGFIYQNKSYTLKGYSLKEIEDLLEDRFINIDRGTLVNKDKIIKMLNDKIYIENLHQTFTVSKRRKKEVKSAILKKELFNR